MFLMNAMDLGYQMLFKYAKPIHPDLIVYNVLAIYHIYLLAVYWSRRQPLHFEIQEIGQSWNHLLHPLAISQRLLALSLVLLFLFVKFENKILFFQRRKQINCHNAQNSLELFIFHTFFIFIFKIDEMDLPISPWHF